MQPNVEKILSILNKLVNIETVNPPGQHYQEAMEVIEDIFKEANLHAKEIWVNGKPNLITKIKQGAGKSVHFNGHIDVVPVTEENWSLSPFKLTQKGNRLYGRGTADMKGALAALITSFENLSKKSFNGEIILTITVDEESGGQDGLKYLVDENIAHSDYFIVGEPTGLNIAICEKGAYWPTVKISGEAAHGATPNKGVNAIERMAEVIEELRKLRLPGEHELLGKPTINIGIIKGGTRVNIVPANCEILIDRRTLPHESLDQVKQQISRVVEMIKERDQDFTYTIEDILIAEAFETSKNEELVQTAMEVVEETTGQLPSVIGLHGFTDARFPARNGIPSIILGPGELAQAHIADEFIKTDFLLQAVQIYQNLTLNLLQ